MCRPEQRTWVDEILLKNGHMLLLSQQMSIMGEVVKNYPKGIVSEVTSFPRLSSSFAFIFLGKDQGWTF